MMVPSLEELVQWPEHRSVHEQAAHVGDLQSHESAMALTMQIARGIGDLIRGGHLDRDQADAVFNYLCSEIGARRRGERA